MIEHIHWLGHATFRIEGGGKVIYIDPYQLKSGEPKADLVLITHAHFDHLSPEDIGKVAKDTTCLVAPPSCTAALSGRVTVIRRDESKEAAGIPVEAVPAYNVDKDFHPQSSDNVGYVITIEGTRIYHAGDTDVIPEMKTIKADIALFPCGGTYTMTPSQAAEAAGLVGPKIAVPMHWGRIVGARKEAEEFARRCKGCEVRILEEET